MSEEISPEKAFSLLGNETRVAIIRELGATEDPRSFSDLHAAVGVRDSGGFNYHLQKLVGTFIRRADGGYELSEAGVRICESIG